jgi:hypothetical protein
MLRHKVVQAGEGLVEARPDHKFVKVTGVDKTGGA